jgi:EAL domain-containing protein (putative c-di-GMP-specific phosphodiesterase class I)
MLGQAVAEVATWNAEVAHGSVLWVSVNLSGRQLADPRLGELVTEALRQNDLLPELLHLEVTETVIIDDMARLISVIEELKAFGVQFSIDDFGTGYSSFSYLKRLPVDTLKIDHQGNWA